MDKQKKDILSVSEVAKLLGYSRTHILRKILKGDITATKIGTTYIVKRKDLPGIYRSITEKDKKEVEAAVDKTLADYEDVIRKLGET